MLRLAITLLSAAMLAYEVLLMRLLAIVQWHHFVYMVVSIALLGFGASGTFLALGRQWMVARFAGAFATGAALFGITALLCFVVAQRLPFNALEVAWDHAQLLYLFALYALFIVPFFCGATCIGLALMRFGERIAGIYACNLAGSGAGALGIVLSLFVLFPTDALRTVSALAITAGAVACLEGGVGRRPLAAAALLALAVVFPATVPQPWTRLRPSPYKGLSTVLQLPGAEVSSEHSSPLGLLTVVRSPRVPFRHAPGLSLQSTVEPPPQLGVYTDGDALTVITAFDGRREPLAYLDLTTGALPYHLLRRPQVLVLGAGGGAEVLQAVSHDAAHVDAVELDGRIVALVRTQYAAFAGGLYGLPAVRVHVGEARGFVAGNEDRWDLIQIPPLDSFGAAAAGVHSLSESYLYTVEAFDDLLGHLRPGGILAITRWLKLPPRDSVKLFATALAALEHRGATEPGRQLALIRGWNTTTLIIKASAPLGAAEIDTIRAFAAARSFDVAYYPGMQAKEANRFNVLDRPYCFEAAMALVGAGRAAYLAGYKFDITPATDDRPYFFDFFRWRALPELLTLPAGGGAAQVEWGYLILFATLLQAAVTGGLLILLPLWVWRRRPAATPHRGRIGAYFLFLGLAFLFVEIAYIQRFVLFLSHPLYAVAVVLSAFLIFAGIGSGCAPGLVRRVEGRNRSRPVGKRGLRLSAIDLAALGIGAVAALYLALLPPLFRLLMPLPAPAKVVISLLLIAPLGFLMGMPFPLGLARVSERAPDLVPWAWGVNGCASVLSPVLATILAIHLGFTAVVAIAIVLYLAAAAVLHPPLPGSEAATSACDPWQATGGSGRSGTETPGT